MSTTLGVRKTPRRAVPPDVCLDFINTLFWRGRDQPTETLKTPADAADWAVAHSGAEPGALPPERYIDVIRLRELLHRLFSAQGAGQPPAPNDFAAFNAALEAAPARATLAHTGAGYSWQTGTPATANAAATALAPVLWAASDMLAAGSRVRVRACANPECGWMFIDASRNGSRRWCDMAACGNRAKAQRHYQRAKATHA